MEVPVKVEGEGPTFIDSKETRELHYQRRKVENFVEKTSEKHWVTFKEKYS